MSNEISMQNLVDTLAKFLRREELELIGSDLLGDNKSLVGGISDKEYAKNLALVCETRNLVLELIKKAQSCNAEFPKDLLQQFSNKLEKPIGILIFALRTTLGTNCPNHAKNHHELVYCTQKHVGAASNIPQRLTFSTKIGTRCLVAVGNRQFFGN